MNAQTDNFLSDLSSSIFLELKTMVVVVFVWEEEKRVRVVFGEDGNYNATNKQTNQNF